MIVQVVHLSVMVVEDAAHLAYHVAGVSVGRMVGHARGGEEAGSGQVFTTRHVQLLLLLLLMVMLLTTTVAADTAHGAQLVGHEAVRRLVHTVGAGVQQRVHVRIEHAFAAIRVVVVAVAVVEVVVFVVVGGRDATLDRVERRRIGRRGRRGGASAAAGRRTGRDQDHLMLVEVRIGLARRDR